VRSIFAKILVWSLATFALALASFWAIARATDRRGPPAGDPFFRMIAMVEDDACRAYEEGGPGRLAAHLRRLDAKLPGEHLLTDERGRDLVTGADRCDLLRAGPHPREVPRLPDGRVVLVGRPRGGRYRLITIARPWFDPPNLLPYYGAVALVLAGMGAGLALHLATPLRRLRLVMERFGKGDLSARVGATRRDEIGAVSRAFDEMAGRIETLLSAERRLLQDVSHELRSPLTRLEVAADLAGSDGDRAEMLDRIKRDIGRLSVLVEELLQLTRVEGDPSESDVEEVRLDELLAGLVEDCELEAEARGCRLELRDGGPCPVRGERELLRRAVENVVRNAIRHAPPGTAVEIDLAAHGETASIVVRDHGPGVPDELLGAIFEPFFRVEGHRSRASGGVGLGLAIARRAVSVHRGRISARNADPGLVIAIELPRRRVVG
jgi:two-component system sensor histidine kinase CpxA